MRKPWPTAAPACQSGVGRRWIDSGDLPEREDDLSTPNKPFDVAHQDNLHAIIGELPPEAWLQQHRAGDGQAEAMPVQP